MGSLSTFIEDAKQQLSDWEGELHALEVRLSELGDPYRTRLRVELQILRADWDAFIAKTKAWELRLDLTLENERISEQSDWGQTIRRLKDDWDHLVDSIQRIKTDLENHVS